MKQAVRQSGFSLMEVMFGVVVLALGLVFVACQFPVAISQSRDVLEMTTSQIDAHNSGILLKLAIDQTGTSETLDSRPGGYTPPSTDLATLHALPKANVLWEQAAIQNGVTGNTWQVVIDDPERYGGYLIGKALSPVWPFWSHRPPNESDYLPVTTCYIGDIGNMMCPAIDRTSQAVEEHMVELMGAHGFDYSSDPVVYRSWLDYAIFHKAIESKYSWAALYHENRGQFYIFTFFQARADVRYPAQVWESFEMHQGAQGEPYTDPPDLLPTAADMEYDRRFPVFWRVWLGNEYVATNRRFRIDQSSYLDTGILEGPDRFLVPAEVGIMLQRGSVIVDGDPLDMDFDGTGNRTTGLSGEVYEVRDSVDQGDGTFLLTLKGALRDDLHYAWIVPPAVKRDGGTGAIIDYEDFQPVVNVKQALISF